MPSLPLPFLTSFFLFFLLLKVTFTAGRRASILPLVAIGSYALQSALLGLVWGYQVTFSLPILAAFAVLIPPLTYTALTSMVSTNSQRHLVRSLVPAGVLSVFVLCIPLFKSDLLADLIDLIVVTVYLAYGGMMLWIAVSVETAWMDQLPFQRLMSASRSFLLAGLAMLFSAVVEIAVSYDLAVSGGRAAPEYVSFSNLSLLLALGWAVLRITRVAPNDVADWEDPQHFAQDEEPVDDPMIDGMTREELRAQQEETMERLDRFMMEQCLYRDESLSLNRLARRTQIPQRQISIAINNLRALNVPQYVNTFRIIEACERLKATDAPVTEIIFDVGFTTKSNFNREFLRVVGVSPSVWRRSAEYDREPSGWPFVSAFVPALQVFSKEFSLLHKADEST